MSKNTLDLIKERNIQQQIASETNNREEWVKFRTLRNKINNRMKYEQKNWQKSKLDQCGENSSNIWKNVKGILQWRATGSPQSIIL